MNVITVDAVEDARLDGYAHVGDERWLAARGCFVAEGRFVVERLLETGRYELESLLLNAAAFAALAPVLAPVQAPIFVCPPRFFERLTGHHFHRGCLALARRPPPSSVGALLTADVRSLLVLDRVADPDNVGSVFRSALAFGVDAVLLGPGSAPPLCRKAIRTSVAATLRVPFAVFGDDAAAERGAPVWPDAVAGAAWPRCLAELSRQGFELLGLSPRTPGVELRELERAGPGERFALLVGTEGAGLSAEVEALASRRVRIAMRPGVDSLNLGVAVGIALHWLTEGGAERRAPR